MPDYFDFIDKEQIRMDYDRQRLRDEEELRSILPYDPMALLESEAREKEKEERQEPSR